MPFPLVSPQSVKSSNQRSLIAHWNALAVERRFPAIDAFSPNSKDHNPEQLIVWDVERADDGSRRFRMRLLGQRAREALGTSMVGKTMDEVVPPSLRAVSLEGANECATSGCAVYNVITTFANGHQVDCERLLLPFGEGGAVEQIVAALQLISFQGPVDRRDATSNFEATSYVSFSGRISSDWGTKNAASEPVQIAAPPLVVTDQPAAADDVTQDSDRSGGADKRKAARRNVIKTGNIFFGKRREVCTVRDISATGAALEVADPSIVPDRFTLVLEMESASRWCDAVWRKHRQIGVRFA
jgi:hypothetical protein